MCEDFDCSIASGDPTGRSMPVGFPEPAQGQVIRKVVQEKLGRIDGNQSDPPIALWKAPADHPCAGRVFIMDGQHRFVAACIRKIKVKVQYKKFGAAGYNEGWSKTVYVDAEPAKETIARNIASNKK